MTTSERCAASRARAPGGTATGRACYRAALFSKGISSKVWTASALSAVLLATPLAHGASLDPNFMQVELPSGHEPYTGMEWAPDGSQRLFLTTKGGTTRIFEAGAFVPTPFMTISEVYTASECGLLAIAFDPNFGENGFVYFFVTVSTTEQRIVRYRADGNVGVEPTTIVSGLPTRGANHDGGALAFGPDGKLYWAIGDLGNGAGSGADLALLASKVGRVNRDGSVPADNPFVDGVGANEDRIWARGFRNPFTMTFRPSSGDLWLNVVGTGREQVFVVGKGDDGGWGLHEAFQPAGFIRPIITYPTNAPATYGIVATGATRIGGVATFTLGSHWFHQGDRVTVAGVTDPSFNGTAFITSVSDTAFTIDQAGPDAMSGSGTASTPLLGGCITGGVFYDSTAASADYRNNFFFGDYNTGNIMRVRLSGDTVRSVEPWAVVPAAVDMNVGPDGDLYNTTHYSPYMYRSRFLATTQYLVVSKTNVWMLEDGVAAFNVRLSVAPTAPVDVRVRLPAAASALSITRGERLTFDPSDWSTPKVVTIDAARDGNRTDDIVELSVASSGLPTEAVRVRIIDEYAAVAPPEGGAGGDSGVGGEGGVDGGAGGVAGEGTGGRGGTSGTAGAAGESTGAAGEGGASDGTDAGGSEPAGGCGCATNRRSGSVAAILVVGLALLRRRGTKPSRR